MGKIIKKGSLCGKCQYRLYDEELKIHRCDAFVGGIPEKYLSGKEKHLEVVEGQTMDVAFELPFDEQFAKL